MTVQCTPVQYLSIVHPCISSWHFLRSWIFRCRYTCGLFLCQEEIWRHRRSASCRLWKQQHPDWAGEKCTSYSCYGQSEKDALLNLWKEMNTILFNVVTTQFSHYTNNHIKFITKLCYVYENKCLWKKKTGYGTMLSVPLPSDAILSYWSFRESEFFHFILLLN